MLWYQSLMSLCKTKKCKAGRQVNVVSCFSWGMWIRYVVFSGGSASLCVERTVRLFLPSQSKQWLFEQLVRRALTHLPGRESVCYENMLMIWLWPSASHSVCRTPWVLFDITTGCVFLLLGRKLKGNPSLSVDCYVWSPWISLQDFA